MSSLLYVYFVIVLCACSPLQPNTPNFKMTLNASDSVPVRHVRGAEVAGRIQYEAYLTLR